MFLCSQDASVMLEVLLVSRVEKGPVAVAADQMWRDPSVICEFA